jgi:hypothetical protein
VPTIIAAKPEANGEGSQIVVWRKIRARESASEPKVEAHTGNRNADIMQILMFLLSLAFVWQNMEVRSNLFQELESAHLLYQIITIMVDKVLQVAPFL